MAKQFVVPGWRVGWLCIHDPASHLGALRTGLLNLSTIILGCTTLVQGALEEVLVAELAGGTALADFNKGYVASLERAAGAAVLSLKAAAPAVTVIEPSGAMYLMAEIHPELLEDIADDKEFALKLLEEEAVFVLPGSCFGAPNFFRVVFTAPEAKLNEAYARIVAFTAAHAKK
jgi:tyrosine aminotransferase